MYIYIVKGLNLCRQDHIRRIFMLIFPEDSTIIRWSCVVDILMGDDLVTLGAMASAVMTSALT